MNEKLQAAVIQALESVQKGMPEYWQQLVTENATRNLWIGCILSISSLIFLIIASILGTSICNSIQKDEVLDEIIKPFAFGITLVTLICMTCGAISHISDYLAPNVALIEIIKSK